MFKCLNDKNPNVENIYFFFFISKDAIEKWFTKKTTGNFIGLHWKQDGKFLKCLTKNLEHQYYLYRYCLQNVLDYIDKQSIATIRIT